MLITSAISKPYQVRI